MRSINVHEAKTHLSRLVEEAARGEPFIIAKSGRPIAMVTAVHEGQRKQTRRIGFLAGQIEVPDDFDTMGREEIERMFGGGE